MKRKGNANIYKRLLMIFTALVMVFVNIAGNMVYASNTAYPDFEVKVTSKNTSGGDIGLGSTINVKMEFDKKIGTSLENPFSHSVYVHEDYVASSNIAYISQMIPNPDNPSVTVPILVVTGSAIAAEVPGYSGNYYRYDIVFNSAAHEIDDSVVKTYSEMYVQLKPDDTIIDIEAPIIIESSDGLTVHKPDIKETDPKEMLIQKTVSKQFRKNSRTGLYELISTDGFKQPQVGDVYEFTIYVKNLNTVPVTINAGDIKDCLPELLTFVDTHTFAAQAAANTVKTYRNEWVKSEAQEMDGYTVYDNINPTVNLKPNHIADYYIYTMAGSTDTNELENQVTIGDQVAFAKPPATGVTYTYDMAIATYIPEIYAGGKDTRGNNILTLSDADNAVAQNLVSAKYTYSLNASSSIPYVQNGDIFRLRTYYYNQSDYALNNITIAFYGLFDDNAVFEFVDQPYDLTDVENIYSYSASGTETGNPDLAIKTILIPETVEANSSGYFDVLVRVKNYPDTNRFDRTIYTEIVSFEDSALGIVVPDSDSTNDYNPYNDMTYRGEFKEKDNVINQNAKLDRSKDEDDFDYAYVRSLADTEKPEKVAISKEINRTMGEGIYEYSKTSGKYVYSNNYSHIAADDHLVTPYTYIPYKISINYGGEKDLRNVEVVDTLPKGMKFLTDDNGKVLYAVWVWQGTGPYKNNPFPVDDNNFYKRLYYYPWAYFYLPLETGINVVCDTNANTITLTAPKIQNKMVDLYVFATIDPENVDYNHAYTNSVVMKADGETQKTELSPPITWNANTAAAYVKKYMKVGKSWVETGSDTLNRIPVSSEEFTVDYQIKILNLSTGEGFSKGALNITDNLGARAVSVSDVTMFGIKDETKLSHEELAAIFSISTNNNTINIENTYSSMPSNNTEYYFNFTVTYKSLNPGQIVSNHLYGKAVYTIKPLLLNVIKTDMDGVRISGAEFSLEYEDGTPVLDTSGNKITLRPGEADNITTLSSESGGSEIIIDPEIDDDTTVFIPRNYHSEAQWNLVLKETKTPKGYEARDYRLLVVKNMEGDLSIIADNGQENYLEMGENNTITLKNELIEIVVDPEDPDSPNEPNPEQPVDPTQPEEPGDGSDNNSENPDTEPSDPTDYADPTGIIDPSNPTDIVDPSTPTDAVDIDDGEIPQGPSEPSESVDMEEVLFILEDEQTPLGGIEASADVAIGIEDEEVPLGSMSPYAYSDDLDDVPQTGDSMLLFTSIILLLVTGLISGFGLFSKRFRIK